MIGNVELTIDRWDIFCAVVDNFGDIGTCWRLARQLVTEHEASVRLWVDNLESFVVLCPQAVVDVAAQVIESIEIRHWTPDFPDVDAADVVIEAFGCTIPDNYVAKMAWRDPAPVWINLEYLSAEAWVEDCHLARSPLSRLPLSKTFFFPGFTASTGGLLCEQGLLAERAAFDQDEADAFLRRLGVPLATAELRVSMFCYDNPALGKLLTEWNSGPSPIRVLVSPGAATRQAADWFGNHLQPGTVLTRNSLTVQALPFLSQSDYDRLLWSCDVNFVRGEDSFVRAQWAQQPFVWQIYPQSADTHLVKLDAFLTRFLGETTEMPAVRNCWHAWNGAGDIRAAWSDFAANRRRIQQHGKVWASQLDRTGNLADNLVRLVRGN
ncbi:MAG: elongation factor P maturation arginine rhamnosyltransferase EarP [Planctomycetes bacterium]|nr:elongation factor P maturation arginine rhamnosyltransferase EarP [Planctomycetota bacterium]